MRAVIVTQRPQNIPNVYPEHIKDEIRNLFDLLDDIKSKDEFVARKTELKDVDVIFSTWGMLPLTKEEIKEYIPNVKAVFYAAGTVQYFAKPFIESGIEVHSAWAANAVPVIEMASAFIILANKGYFQRIVKSRSMWSNNDPQVFYPGNYKTKVGLLGAGMIGKGVINKLKSTELDIYVFDPFLPDEVAANLGVTKKDLDWIFENCNVVSNHLANNGQTKGMITKKQFDKMGDHAVFINTGRAAQTVEEDLIQMLKDKPGRLAILDVTDPIEPPVENSELYTLDNVILSPHICGSTGNEVQRLAAYMIDESKCFLNNTNGKYNVTLEMLKTMA